MRLETNLEAGMVKGNLDVLWENAPTPKEQRIYKIMFSALGESGAVRHQKSVRGEESLREYFVGLQDQAMPLERRQHWANQWLLELQSSKGSLPLGLISITDQQLEDFSK
jgi:hypothetical protein